MVAPIESKILNVWAIVCNQYSNANKPGILGSNL